jgi:hypothetical protein
MVMVKKVCFLANHEAFVKITLKFYGVTLHNIFFYICPRNKVDLLELIKHKQ